MYSGLLTMMIEPVVRIVRRNVPVGEADRVHALSQYAYVLAQILSLTPVVVALTLELPLRPRDDHLDRLPKQRQFRRRLIDTLSTTR